MADQVQLVPPSRIDRNPENPRLIFRQDELEALEKSISEQGILVPLTVYREGNGYRLLDGERRWRCSQRLGFKSVPVIIQPKPGKLQNLMMMFAIHKFRKDWDPLPTALKLQDLENEFKSQHNRLPNESELAGISSLTRGQVRRLKKLLAIPSHYRKMLLDELKKPRSEQKLTVDVVLETTKGVEALVKASAIDATSEEALRRAIIKKFMSGVVTSTVEPRYLVRIARGVSKGEVSARQVMNAMTKLADNDSYGIMDAYHNTVETAEACRTASQLADRTANRIRDLVSNRSPVTDPLKNSLLLLKKEIDALLGSRRS